MRSVFLLIFATGIAVACAKPPSPVAETWGNSTHAIRAAQTQNPEADHGPVERLDPRSAEHVLDAYTKGQENQEHGKNRVRDPLLSVD